MQKKKKYEMVWALFFPFLETFQFYLSDKFISIIKINEKFHYLIQFDVKQWYYFILLAPHQLDRTHSADRENKQANKRSLIWSIAKFRI